MKSLPTACDVFCPTRLVCERCWRGRCDYEAQAELCFGCVESSCYSERVAHSSNYREAKQRAASAAIAKAAADAVIRSDGLAGFAATGSRSINFPIPPPKTIVVIQNDKAQMFFETDSIDVGQVKLKPKKGVSLPTNVPSTALSLPENSSSLEKRRIGHLPDVLSPSLPTIVDQRVWVPVSITHSKDQVKHHKVTALKVTETPFITNSTRLAAAKPEEQSAKTLESKNVITTDDTPALAPPTPVNPTPSDSVPELAETPQPFNQLLANIENPTGLAASTQPDLGDTLDAVRPADSAVTAKEGTESSGESETVKELLSHASKPDLTHETSLSTVEPQKTPTLKLPAPDPRSIVPRAPEEQEILGGSTALSKVLPGAPATPKAEVDNAIAEADTHLLSPAASSDRSQKPSGLRRGGLVANILRPLRP